MKITSVKRVDTITFEVTFTPNFFERLFGVKEKREEFREIPNRVYEITRTPVFIKRTGEVLACRNPIVDAIENYKRKW